MRFFNSQSAISFSLFLSFFLVSANRSFATPLREGSAGLNHRENSLSDSGLSDKAQETLRSLRANNVEHYVLGRKVTLPNGNYFNQTLILAGTHKAGQIRSEIPTVRPKSERSWEAFFLKYGTLGTLIFVQMPSFIFLPKKKILFTASYLIVDKLLRHYFAFTDTMVGALFFPGAYFGNWSEVTSASDSVENHLNKGHSEVLFLVKDKFLEVNKNDLIDRLGYKLGQ